MKSQCRSHPLHHPRQIAPPPPPVFAVPAELVRGGRSSATAGRFRRWYCAAAIEIRTTTTSRVEHSRTL
jgi:hypothetical protein